MTQRPVLRFAPSPNGYLHLGHALSALVGFRLAQQLEGRFLLRIEDIDTARTRPELIAAIEEDLIWLGISWEQPVLRQSQHFPDYAAALHRLEDLGVLYRCPATRGEVLAAARRLAPSGIPATDPDGAPIFPGLTAVLPADEITRRLDCGAPFAHRLDMGRALGIIAARAGADPLTFDALDISGRLTSVICRPELWGDVVLARKDTLASYHLCVVVDDARQGITHVTRGLDLLAATDVHRVLQELLGLPAPLYHHHPLVLGPDGRKLSKSEGSASLRSLREGGAHREDVLRLIGLTEE